MTKLFIENLDKVNAAGVRIYRVGGDGVDDIPESFTMMDMLDASFGVGLLPAPKMECVGTVSRSGGLVFSGTSSMDVAIVDEVRTIASPGGLVAELANAGYTVNVLTPWVSPVVVSPAFKCASGEVVATKLSAWSNTRFDVYINGELIGNGYILGVAGSLAREKLIADLRNSGVEITFPD